MKIDGLVREGWRSVSGMTGCVPHVLNHQWVRVGGFYELGKGGGGVGVGVCVWGGGGGVKCRGDKESWVYTGLEDGWRTGGARWETMNDGTSVGGGQGIETEGVVDRECQLKGPERPGRGEGVKGEEGVRGIGSRGREDGLEPKRGVGLGGGGSLGQVSKTLMSS